jgi:hypothetical protein
VYKYDAAGNRIEFRQYDGKKLAFKRVSKYDKDGIEIQLISYVKLEEPETLKKAELTKY